MGPDATKPAPQAMPQMRATPRIAPLGAIADALSSIDRFANVPDPTDPTQKGRKILAALSNFAGVGDMGATVDRMSYGLPLTEGTGMARQMLPETKNALLSIGPNVAKYPKQAMHAAMAMNGLGDMGQGMNRAAIVYHGSPHKFDKFDSSKIGTGEGKQQQGIGSYLAEVQAVGQKYADKEAWKRGMDSGYLYKVDMPDSLIASMANHEAPLSSQPKTVIDAVSKMVTPEARKALKDYHGWDSVDDAPFAAVLDSLEIANGNNRAATSEALRKAGIPGIRYLDGGSRGAGAGTSNFVVFPGEENALTILERNGAKIGR